MMMVLGACLFVLMFILMKSSNQAFLLASFTSAGDWLASWAPFSYLFVALFVAAPFIAIYVIKTWPEHEEPENPMAKYRREAVDDGE